MSQTRAEVTGTLQPDGTLILDRKPDLPAGRVRVTVQVESAPAGAATDLTGVMETIWAEQRARGHVPRTREEIDAELNALRDEAEEEMRAVERLHRQAARTQGPDK